MSVKVTLTIADESFSILRCRYGFHRPIDSKGRPKGGMKSGEILLMLESSSNTLLLERMLTKEPVSVPGKLEFLDEEKDRVLRTIEWEEGYIYSVSECMWGKSHMPMTQTIAITPLRLDFNRSIKIDRRFPQTYAFWWAPYKPEENRVITHSSQVESTKSIVHTEWTGAGLFSTPTCPNNIRFGAKVNLHIRTRNLPDGEVLEVTIQPSRFTPATPYDKRNYSHPYSVEVQNNEAILYDIPVFVHWPLVAEVKSEHLDLQKTSDELQISLDSNGCGFQYLTYSKSNPAIPVSRIVEIDVYVVVTENRDDYLNYQRKNEDIKRLKEYLEWGFNQKLSRRKQKKNPDASPVKFKDKEGVPILFKFNMQEYVITEKTKNVSEFNSIYGSQTSGFRNKQVKRGKYGCSYNSCVFGMRLKPGVSNEGGTVGSYGGGYMILLLGDRPGANESMDKNIIHEITHAFYGYNSDLIMERDRAKHNNLALGGTGTLSYNGSSQYKANAININKIIETIPYANDRQIP